MSTYYEYICCPRCDGKNIVETDYEDENGEEQQTGRRCDDCGWDGDITELVSAKK